MRLPTGTLTREQWRARPAKHTPRRLDPSDRPGVELHHSVGIYGARTAGQWASAMQDDHLRRPNYADVWYALGIWTDGTPVELRGLDYRSAPTDSLTVCLAGNYDDREPSDAQWATLDAVRLGLYIAGGGSRLTWHALRGGSSCPGRRAILRASRSQALTTGDDDMTPDQAKQLAELHEALVVKRNADRDLQQLRLGVRAIAAKLGLRTQHEAPTRIST